MTEQITADDILAEWYLTVADALIGTIVDYTEDHWWSDWNGDEVGFDDVNVVGLYSIPDSPISYYVDTENGYVLDAWAEVDED